jgi:hypothetical protein
MVSTNPNSHRITDHDKCVVESLNHIIRHQNVVVALLEQLLEHNQDTDTDEGTQPVMVSVFTTMQYIASDNDSSKSVLDDFGQKWKLSRSRVHTPPDKGKQNIVHSLCSVNEAMVKRQSIESSFRHI